MKLDFDIVRDVLLEIEEETDLDHFLVFHKADTNADKLYAIMKLDEAGYINANITKFKGGEMRVRINSLTWEGHEFLDNIRSPEVYNHAKNTIMKIGSASLTILADVAAAFIKNSLGF